MAVLFPVSELPQELSGQYCCDVVRSHCNAVFLKRNGRVVCCPGGLCNFIPEYTHLYPAVLRP